MAFRTFVYLDVDKLNDYASVLPECSFAETSRNTRKSVKAQAGFGLGKVEAGLESAQAIESRLTISRQYDVFEKALERLQGDDYFDLLIDSCDIATLPPLSLFRTSGYVETPDSFDSFAMISEFAPLLKKAGALTLEGDPETNEFMLSFFEQTEPDIPILITGREVPVCAKLKTSFFVDGDYRMLEDIGEEEVFALCKVHSHLYKDRVVVFDPAKDFLKLNRALRRSIGNANAFKPIVENGPILKAEVIAIYH